LLDNFVLGYENANPCILKSHGVRRREGSRGDGEGSERGGEERGRGGRGGREQR